VRRGTKANLLEELQVQNEDVFTRRAVHDGIKNMFSTKELQFPDGNNRQAIVRLLLYFSCSSSNPAQFDVRYAGKTFTLRLTRVNTSIR